VTATATLLTLLGSFALSAALTPLVRSLAHRTGLVARPHRDRWHPDPIPVLGGFAIAAAFFLTTALSTTLAPLVPLLIGAGLMFGLGALDDVLHFGAGTKLAVQTIIAAVVVFLMPPARIFGLAPLDELLAVVWMVGITNAFNLLDNIDGLSGGIAVIAGVFLLAALAPGGVSPLTLAVTAFIGAALGFLIYNVRPASIFMGDSGSLFLGSFLGGAALLAAPGLRTNVAPVAAIPLFILLIPIFDTAFVSVTRRLAGRNPLVGGRDHLSHRLVAMGVDERRAVVGLYLLAAFGGVIALSLQHADVAWSAILIAIYVIVLAGVGIVLGNVDAHAADADRRLPPLVSEVTYRNRVFEVVLDLALIALAYYAAFRFRFQQPEEFNHFLPYFATSFPLVIACQLAGLALAGKYRQVWRNLGTTELLALLRGIAFGFAGSALLMLYMYGFVGFSRLVFVFDAALLVFLLVGSRLLITSVDEYIRTRRGAGRRALIYGAGVQGRLLVRALLEDRTFGLLPVGFIDDDVSKRRLRVEGVPIVGTLTDLIDILETRQISEVLISTKAIDRMRVAEAAAVCREREVQIRAMRFTLEDIGPMPVPAPAIRHVQGR
jgi:UDP-GlcNAc:undecaprenyl-phosphate GlcNAc-1-phosphate transferase